jgi:ABC-type histidine transport system ATPase subunit
MVALIRLQNISRRYQMGTETVHALRDVSLEIQRGDYVAIMGPSGSGKSTLMNVVGCLDTPTSGTYELNGVNVSEMDDNQLAEVRNREIGFVFQTFNLLPRSNALHNVELPLIYNGTPAEERLAKAKRALEAVDLSDRMHHKPSECPLTSAGGSRSKRSRKSASPTACITSPTNFPVANASAFPSPAHWSTNRPFFWRMSRRATSIPRPARKSWRYSRSSRKRATPSSW